MSTFKRCPVVLHEQKRETCVGLIQCHKEWKSCITPEEDFNIVGDLSFGKNVSDGVFEYWKPMAMHILSNDIKDIKDGDWVYVDCRNTPTGYDGFGVWKYMKAPCPMPYWGNPNCCKKIIASTDLSLNLPTPSKSFVMKYITIHNKGAIITSSPITDVLVDYEDKGYQKLMNPEEPLPTKQHHYWIDNLVLRVDSTDNTISIRSIKNNYTENEVLEILNDFAKSIDTVDKQVHPEKYVKTWINDNLTNPF
jgi:hypothetical protein